jgi:hypothetical protein
MLRAAVLSVVASCLCATIVPVAVAAASPAPPLGLDTILASPPNTDYQEIDPSTPGILEGPFDADGYASIGGPDTSSTVKTLADDGFIAGFGRAWVHAASHRVLVEIVVAFTGGKGASKWLSQSQEADLADPTYQYAIAVDGIDSYYGARMSDSAHYFADAFVFVKGNDGFLVSTISDSDNLGDSAAAQTRVQYRRAPAYTIPPSGWPGATSGSLLSTLTDLGPRLIAGVAAAGVALWLGVTVWMRARRRRAGAAAAAQDAGLPNGL